MNADNFAERLLSPPPVVKSFHEDLLDEVVCAENSVRDYMGDVGEWVPRDVSRSDQTATELREYLVSAGVDVTDRDQVRAMVAILWSIWAKVMVMAGPVMETEPGMVFQIGGAIMTHRAKAVLYLASQLFPHDGDAHYYDEVQEHMEDRG